MRPSILILLAFQATSAMAESEDVPKRVYDSRRAEEAPVLDGRLDDDVWSTVDWSGDFIQREPAEGVPPSQQTRFKVVYDDDALYFAFHLQDDPEQVSRQLGRRDRFPGDWIEVNIDSYFDRRTAFSFTLSCSGTQGDEFDLERRRPLGHQLGSGMEWRRTDGPPKAGRRRCASP